MILPWRVQLLWRLSIQFLFLWLSILVTCEQVVSQRADDVTAKFNPSQIEFFENEIRPILVDHCLQCHGADKTRIRGGLWLTSRESMLEGGDSGPAIVPGNPQESLLIQSVHYDAFEMPPSGKLSVEKIAALEEWIEMGAPDPRETDENPKPQAIDIQAGKQFWSFKPVEAVQVPATRSDWPQTAIDQFIWRRLQQAGIEPVPDASRETLIRRAYIALIGLPPTPEQIDQFVEDPRDTPNAFDAVVEQLLDSPHFGERWGRHWLDVARFAESSGGGRSLMFTDAWRYRDYVIDSFNRDKPINQFIKEQIAGDLLPYENHAQKIEQIVATGFLALGPTNYEQQDKELLNMEVVDEQIDTVGRAFMGMTLGCARCHDHKFDPIPMTDYYALAGIFGSTVSLVDGNVSKYVEQTLATKEEIAKENTYRNQVAELTKKLDAAKKQLAKMGYRDNKQTLSPISIDQLRGVVVDNEYARHTGLWKKSTSVPSYVGRDYMHDNNENKGEKQVVFQPKLDSGGIYRVFLAYTPGGNRASNVPVTIDHQDGQKQVIVNQSEAPSIDGTFVSLGSYRFEADSVARVTISNEDTDGYVIVDAVVFLKVGEETTNRESGLNHRPITTRHKANNPTGANRESKAVQELRVLIRSLDQQLTALKRKPPRPTAKAMSVRDSATPADGHVRIRGSVRNLGPQVKRGFLSVCCEGDHQPDLQPHESGRLQLAEWIANPSHPLTARVYVNRVWRHLFGIGLVRTTDNFGMVGEPPSHPELLDYLAAKFVARDWSTKDLIRSIMQSRVYQLGNDFDADCFRRDDQNRLLWRANRRRVDVEVLRDSILFVAGSIDKTPGGLTIRKLSQYDLGYKFDTVRRSVYVPAFRNSMLDFFEVFDFANPNLVIGDRNTSTLPTQALFLMNSPMVAQQSKMAARKFLKAEVANQQQRIVWVYRTLIGREPNEDELEVTKQYLSTFDSIEDGWASFCHAMFASLEFRYIE